jgi:ribosomal protein L22
MTTGEPEKPRRRRRRKPDDSAAEAVTPADEAARAEPETPAEDETTRAATSSEATAESASEDVEPTPSDVEAEEAAADVMVEAEDEAEGIPEEEPEAEGSGEPEAEESEAPAPARRRRRRGAAATEEAQPATPAKPAPTRRRRSERDPSLPPPVVRAQAKYVRSSARKARLVCDHIRGKSVEEARAILALTPRAIAKDWSKLLESAVANAENNHELVGEDLYVKAVHADEGPTIKRFRPRALGRATRIRKRTSHLTILLTPKD